MAEYLGPSQRKCPSDLRIENFLGRNRSQISDLRLGHRKHGLQTICVEIFLPHIMWTWCKHGDQPAITQHCVAIGRNNKACLEVKIRKSLVRLIGIAGKEHAELFSQRTERFIFRAARCKADLAGKIWDRNAPRIGGEQIFRQHCQLNRLARILVDENRTSADGCFQLRYMALNGLPCSSFIRQALQRSCGKLHSDCGIGSGICHGVFLLCCKRECGCARTGNSRANARGQSLPAIRFKRHSKLERSGVHQTLWIDLVLEGSENVPGCRIMACFERVRARNLQMDRAQLVENVDHFAAQLQH